MPVTLPFAESGEVDPHHLGPQFSFSEKFFLRKSVVRVSRRQGVLEVELHESFLHPQLFRSHFPRLLVVLQAYSPGLLKILDHSEKTTGHASTHLDLADGASPYSQVIRPDACLYAFTRQKQFPGIGLIPDPYSLADISTDVGFVEYRDKEDARAAYEPRKAVIFWRGSTTGRTTGEDIHNNQRVQFCIDALECRSSIDAKITEIVQFPSNKAAFKALLKAGVMAPRVIEPEFANYKASIDLDGNTSAWGALRKYLRLVHVLKPRSNFEMFYHVAQPAETFTAIENTRDLFRKLEADANLADNFETAWRGYCFARQVRRTIASGDATVLPL